VYRLFPSILNAIIVVQPEMVIRCHGRGLRASATMKSNWTPTALLTYRRSVNEIEQIALRAPRAALMSSPITFRSSIFRKA
jgi:hypothetical protein